MSDARLRDIERRLRDIERNLGNLPVRHAATGGGDPCPVVATLPAIPTVGRKRVIWGDETLITDGTGDNQVWEANAGGTRWYPQDKPTDKSGAGA